MCFVNKILKEILVYSEILWEGQLILTYRFVLYKLNWSILKNKIQKECCKDFEGC